MEIVELDSTCSLIKLLDRGGLKWSSKQVLNAVFTLWKMSTNIECTPTLTCPAPSIRPCGQRRSQVAAHAANSENDLLCRTMAYYIIRLDK